MQVDLLSAPARAPGFAGPVFPNVPAGGAPDNRALLAEADHRIGNHLGLLAGYVRLQTAALAKQGDEPSRASTQILLAGIGAQIASVSRLHRALSSDNGWGSADLGEHLHQVCAGFVTSFAGAEITEDILPGCTVRLDQVLPLSQIVSEVITMALRRAQGSGRSAKIVVGSGRDDCGRVVVEITDRVPGPCGTFDPEADGGIGYRLLTALGRQLGACIGFESTGQAVHFRLTLPRPTVWLEPSPPGKLSEDNRLASNSQSEAMQ